MPDLPRPIVIIGPPRSYTSAIAQVFAAHGVWVGPSRKPDEGNPYGYCENKALADLRKDGLVDPARVEGVLRYQGWRGEPWMVKHTPVKAECWRSIKPIYVLAWRDAKESVISLARRRRALGQPPFCALADYEKTVGYQEMMRAFTHKNISVRMPYGREGLAQALRQVGIEYQPEVFRAVWKGMERFGEGAAA